MATGLFTPVVDVRSPHAPYYFNGRLLTGEAMTDEQRAQHAAHELLAQGLGDGVVHGLQVALSTALNTVDRPVVTVKAGAAISRRGDLLLLAADTDVELVRPVTTSVAAQKIFDRCNPPQQGVYVADGGVYLLTIAPVAVGNGLAPVSGLGGGNSCNVKYRVDAVQFRLVKLPIDDAMLSDVNTLRNRVAYACFGVDQTAMFARNPLGVSGAPRTLLDDLDGQIIADCDVPLAVTYWTATGGIQFIDLWAVRRRVTHSRSATGFSPLSDKRLAAQEAMVLQFQGQIDTLKRTLSQAPAIVATNHFRYLPPVGFLPVATPASTGISSTAFFTGLTTQSPAAGNGAVFIEGARVQFAVQEALSYFPIETTSKELIWLYRVRENQQPIDRGGQNLPTPALMFVTGHAPYRADPHFDVAKWNYSNYV
jgi:hypothetical protein